MDSNTISEIFSTDDNSIVKIQKLLDILSVSGGEGYEALLVRNDERKFVFQICTKETSESTSVFGRYTDEYDEMEEIGKGAFGRAFRCINKVDKMEYVIKMVPFNKEDLDLILSEVRALSRLHHPHIVRYYQSWVEDAVLTGSGPEQVDGPEATLFIVMEFCPMTLTKKLDNGLCVKDIHRFHNQLKEGLDYIHEKGVIHSDIKPDNLFIDRSGMLKIGDFGIATSTGTGQYSVLHDDEYDFDKVVTDRSLFETMDVVDAALVMLRMAVSPIDPKSDSKMAKLFEDAWSGRNPIDIDSEIAIILQAVDNERPDLHILARQQISDYILRKKL